MPLHICSAPCRRWPMGSSLMPGAWRSVAALVFFARALVAALRAGGVVRARPRPQAQPRPVAEQAVAPAVPSAVAPAGAVYRPDLEQTMAALAAALAADLNERRKGDNKV